MKTVIGYQPLKIVDAKRKVVSAGRMGLVMRAQQQQGQRARPEYIPNRIEDPNYVRIFDTTLRDGEQSPGATLTSKEKLEIAKQLSKLGKSIHNAGHMRVFAAS